MKLGIPKAFVLYKHPGLWESFFNKLGVEVISSGLTDKEIMREGVKITESESCLPVKIFYGHCKKLISQNVDAIFTPHYISLREKRLGCPKFFAIGDLIPAIFDNAPEVISPLIDVQRKNILNTMIVLGKRFVNKKSVLVYAAKKSIEQYKCSIGKKREELIEKLRSSRPKIVLMSHPYNLYDSYVNSDIAKILKGLGVESIMIDAIRVTKPYPQEYFFHWDFGIEMLNQVDEVLKKNIDGGIQLSTFNCGCDSVLKEFIEKKFRMADIPYMSLIIDEHTAEAGMLTRLEAFVDTLTIF
ncbi:MAG: hypothetical protein ACD_63C00051G0005 [uncultured bacterium]|nr:MAG: hypothetical protein ACD_63C00051G0005 [uncultured bacterium]